MMEGRFREYNWDDVMNLIYKDAGLETDEARRTMGEPWLCGGLQAPKHSKDTCVKVQVYDKPFSERIREHASEV